MQIKITNDPLFRKKAESRKSGRAESSAAAGEKKSPFLEILEEVLPQDRVENRDLHELWRDLPDAEKDLINHPSEENLRRYRDLVVGIAKATLARNVHIKKMRRKNSKGETVELSVVEVVDQRIQKMAIMMHSRGNSAFNILRTVEEIRGILFDARE